MTMERLIIIIEKTNIPGYRYRKLIYRTKEGERVDGTDYGSRADHKDWLKAKGNDFRAAYLWANRKLREFNKANIEALLLIKA
jgi:hypothetical protein